MNANGLLLGLVRSLLIAVMSVAMTSCGLFEDEFGAAKVEMENGTAASLTAAVSENGLTYSAPTHLGVKLIAVYLSKDVRADGFGPNDNTIYIHPECLVPEGEGDGTKSVTSNKEAHIGRCDVEDGGISSNTEKDKIDLIAKNYLDLSASSESVNDEIAAQGFQVKLDTYRYVTITSGGGGGGQGVGEQVDSDGMTYPAGSMPTVKFWHDGMGGTASDMSGAVKFRHSFGAMAKFPDTLEVTEGSKVVVKVSYDLSKAYATGDASAVSESTKATFDNCTTVGEKIHCIKIPDMTATVEKVSSLE